MTATATPFVGHSKQLLAAPHCYLAILQDDISNTKKYKGMHFTSLKSLRTQFWDTAVELGPGPDQDFVTALLCMHDSSLSVISRVLPIHIPHPSTPCISAPYHLYTLLHIRLACPLPPHTYTHTQLPPNLHPLTSTHFHIPLTSTHLPHPPPPHPTHLTHLYTLAPCSDDLHSHSQPLAEWSNHVLATEIGPIRRGSVTAKVSTIV